MPHFKVTVIHAARVEEVFLVIADDEEQAADVMYDEYPDYGKLVSMRDLSEDIESVDVEDA